MSDEKPMLADYGYDTKLCETAEAILRAEHEGWAEPEDVLLAALNEARDETSTCIERAILSVLERDDMSMTRLAAIADGAGPRGEMCTMARAIEAALRECRKGRE